MSYGTNAPQGLQPFSTITGACWNQQTTPYFITSGYNQSLYSGDPVTLQNDGSIIIGSTGQGIIGVFWGVQYRDTNGTLINSAYWTASTATWNPGGTGNVPAVAYVIDDPNVVFNIQANAGITQTSLNLNYNFASGTGSAISGQSAYSLNLSSGNTTATLNLKLLQLTPAVNNSFGTTYNNGLVIINNHILKGGTGTAGV